VLRLEQISPRNSRLRERSSPRLFHSLNALAELPTLVRPLGFKSASIPFFSENLQREIFGVSRIIWEGHEDKTPISIVEGVIRKKDVRIFNVPDKKNNCLSIFGFYGILHQQSLRLLRDVFLSRNYNRSRGYCWFNVCSCISFN
jgi:hypothetical protein